MRVLALLTDAFGGRGGIAQYNRDFLVALLHCMPQSRIEILVRHAPAPFCGPAGVVQRAPHGKIGYALAALCALFCRPPRIVFCGHRHLAPLAAVIARLGRAKLIVQMHGIEAWRRPSRFERAALEAADLVLCVSRYTRHAVLSSARIAPERVLVLPNTVGQSFAPGEGSALRRALGLDGKRILLTVGRFDSREQYKGHDRVIDAIPALLALGHDVVYAIVGEGDDRERLEARATEQGVGDRLRFLGSLSLADLVAAYRMADLFVMPSEGEGFGIAYLEAMACGLPALGLAVAGACDALGEGALGTLVSGPDLAAAIARRLDTGKTDAEALARRTQARFGREPFRAQLRAQLERLCEAA